MTRHWTINGRFLAQPLTGVQRYAREIVHALDAHVAAGHPLARGLDLEVVTPPGAGSDLELSGIPLRTAGKSGGHLWEQLWLPRAIPGGLLSLCNTGPVAVRRHIVCMHDVNTRLVPQSYAWQFRLTYRVLAPVLGRTAARLSTVSNFSAAQISRLGIAHASKMSVVPDGHEHVEAWTAQHSPATKAASGPATVVVIGSPAPHKNVGMLLGLAGEMAAAGLRLAIVGASDPRVFAAGDAVCTKDNVIMLGRLGDAGIAALLQDCLCLAVPSLTEGFGLPPLEAMVMGCPVVVSDRGSLPEICGAAALYAPPDKPQAWLAHFRALAADEGLRRKMRARGYIEAARYSWRQSAERYLELMAELDALGSERTQVARHGVIDGRPPAVHATKV